MEDSNNDAKHGNNRGETVSKQKIHQPFSTQTRNFGLNQHLQIKSGDIALEQKDYLAEKVLSTQLSFWKEKLIDSEALNLITDYPRPSQMNNLRRNKYFELDEYTSTNIRNLAEKLKVGLHTVLLSGYYLMLRSYSNQNDIVIGTLMADRQYSRIEKLNGVFVNTLAIRIQIDSTSLLRDFIKDVDRDIIISQQYQDLPFEKLVEKLGVAKDTSRHPIFQVMFALRNFETTLQGQSDEDAETADLLEPYTGKSPYDVTNLDLITIINESEGVLRGIFNYATTLYKEETIHRFIETYVEILSQLSTLDIDQTKEKPNTIADLSYLSAEQYHKIIHEWNSTDLECPADKTFHQLFEEQVAKTPDNVAIVYKNLQLTYRELNERANRLAIYLREKYNIEPDSLIPLCLNRNEHMLIAILAVWKSGGAFVPIDPSYPVERIKYILQDINSNLLLTNFKHKERLDGIKCSGKTNEECLEARQPIIILSIDTPEFQDTLPLQAVNNPFIITTSAHLACVNYTSGTTGKPKPVMVQHSVLVNLNYALVHRYGLSDANDKEVILQFPNYVFNLSFEQIVLALLNGHVLLIMPYQLWLNADEFIDYLFVNKVTHITATPRFLEQQNFDKIVSLKRLVSAGELLSKRSYNKIRKNNSINLIIAYGLTETIVACTFKIDKKGDLSIGAPIPNFRCYVLNEDLIPVPVGGIGELYIGGAGVARGYFNRPDLTAERFIANPFQTKEEKVLGKNSRIYKTGDLVRWLPGGNLECIGRNDFQVKIRGYRIELAEIESALLSYAGIKQTVALAKEHKNVASESSGNKYLVGYYVSDDKQDEEAILQYLGSKLPDYMVPTKLVHLKNIPLTSNGKLDRNALPDPEFASEDNYVAPRNEIEEKVCQILGEVLGLKADKVSTHDDFFRLGGDSIICIQLVGKLRKILQLDVSVKDIFSYRSVAKLYENVFKKEIGVNGVSNFQTEQGVLVGAVPLLPIQDWFFWRNFPAANHWNISFLIKTPRLDLGKLEDSLDKLVQHHDGFRLRFRKDEKRNTYEQYYDNYNKVNQIKVLDVSTLEYHENTPAFKTNLQEVITNWKSDFDLAGGPMHSIGYIYGYQDGSARIHFALHHLIGDDVSRRIVTEDLRDIYYGKSLGRKGSSYRQWAKILKDYPTKHPDEQHFWNKILSDYDKNRINNFMASESTAHSTCIELSEEYTRLLLQESNQAYHTQINDLMLTALGNCLTEITGSNVNHILLKGHGREEIDSSIDIARTLGCFTTIYPFRLQIVDGLGTSIRYIKESLRTIPHKGLGFGSISGYKSNDLPSVTFQYLGQFGRENHDEQKDKDIWQLLEDSEIPTCPSNWETNVVNFNGVLMEGRLQFKIVTKLDEKATNNLASIFKQQLEVIIDHTTNQPRNYLTGSDIGYIISKKRLDTLQKSREIHAIYLANSLQQGFIYHALSQGDVDDAYIVQHFWQYHCSINIDSLKQAWEYAQDKFSSLRLRFDWQDNLVQIIDKEGSVDWRYTDLSDELNIGKQESTIKDIQEKDRLERYDLYEGNLFRIYLIKQNWDLYSCIFSNHHAILDGWSMSILLEYIHEIYLKLDRKELIFFQPDHTYEAAQRYIQDHREDNKAYWDKYIAQIDERSDLTGLLLKTDKRLSEYKQILYPIDKKLTIAGNVYNSLKLLSQQEGVTLNAVLQYVWHKVLHVYGNNEQTIVGTTLSGRGLPIDDIEKSVGLYIITLPLIVNHQAKKSVIESIKEIQASISEFIGRSIVNLAELQPSAERLFDSLFIYQNYPNPGRVAQDEVKLMFKGSVEKLDYPIIVIAYEANNEIVFQIQYAGELFSEDTINNFLYLTRTLLEQLLSHAHQSVTNLRFLNARQYDQIIHRWNTTNKDYPADKTIHHIFEEQVAKTPENIAIVFKEVQLTYRELNERANQLAIFLIKEFNVQPDNLILLCFDRGEHMLIAILAVLKSGGAYVPIDPSYPDERIQYIMQDTNSSLLLTGHTHEERLKGIICSGNNRQECLKVIQPLNILSIDCKGFLHKISVQAGTNPNTITTSNHLAYVIYTSGTTGKPKGVMVEHRGLVNLNYDLVNRYELGDANDREVILQFSNYVFDASVEQIIIGLLNGHVLLLIPNHLLLNKERFLNYLLVNKATHIDATPRFLEQHNFSKLLSLKRIVTGGESLSRQSYEKICLYNSINIINAYGVTETSVTSIIKIIKKGDLNIGSPISNTKCYVLADNLVPVPVGAIGELFIGGVGLARGYLNRTDITAEKFIANPFQTKEEKVTGKNTKIYKTGDLVRWLPDGTLEYIGRKDLQVKIRGYRIELGDIESALLGYKGIQQGVVLTKEHCNVAGESSGYKYLVGYYVSDDKLDEEAILQYVRSKLPDYMVPTKLVPLKNIPLTINGKIDRNALPNPEVTGEDNYVAPKNEIEVKARQILGEVLGLNADKISTHDDFFRLGGDSIICIQLVGKLRKILQLNVSVSDIFSYRSIARLYENVFKKELGVDGVSSLQTEQGVLVGAVPLLPIQEWFFWRNFPAANHWNISFLIKTPRLELGKLEDSLDKLVQHHDGFRLRFRNDKKRNTYEQYYDGYAKVKPVNVLDITTLGYQENTPAFKTNLQEVLTSWQTDFDLTDGPMHSVGYIHGYQEGSARIHFALHHLIGDDISRRILTDDLRDIYYGKSLGRKGSSYRQWAKILKDYPSKHQDEQHFWNKILSDYDKSRLNNFITSESAAHSTSIELSEEYTRLLLQESNQAYDTQIDDLMLTALGYSLTEITGSNVNHIVLEGHGREEIDSSIDITRTLGWFTTIFPVRLEIADGLGPSIRHIKESLRTIPHKGLGFGSISGYKSNALPNVTFDYLGQFGRENCKEQNDKEIWQVVGEDSGISMSPKNWETNVVNFNGVLMEGRLQFKIVSKLDEKTTNDLARIFKQQLEVIIRHTINQTRSFLSMNDEGHTIGKKNSLASDKNITMKNHS